MSIWRTLFEAGAVLGGGVAIFVGQAIYTGNERFYREVVMPTSGALLSPESAHRCSVWLASKGFLPRTAKRALEENPRLVTRVFGLNFRHPIGLAAGFDKDGEATSAMLHNVGFAFVEIGSVTPQPQPGNEKPRVFRLSDDQAIINRYGFNSAGHKAVLARLEAAVEAEAGGPIGVNLGKNRETQDAAADFVEGVRRFGAVADYLVVNVSSPNTPGLRALQRKEAIGQLLRKVIEARNALPKRPPLLLKLSPDLSDSELADLCAVITTPANQPDGLIVANTTIARPSSLRSSESLTGERGGLSGRPLTAVSTSLISKVYRLTGGKIPIIGCGGVSSGAEALEKLRAGASFVQLYSALAFEGPPVVERICRELDDLLERDGAENVRAVVGSDHVSLK